MRSGLFKLPQDKDVRKITKIMYPCKPDIFDKTYERVADLTEDKIGMTFGKAFEFVKQDGDNYMRLSKWAPDVKIKAWLPWPTEKDNKREMTAPFLYVESRFGRVPWKETMIELFSDDWEIGRD